MAYELDEAVRAISSVLSDPRIDQSEKDQLIKAKRELNKLARSGKVDRRRVYRIVTVVSKVILAAVSR
jgi:hypothetical protein